MSSDASRADMSGPVLSELLGRNERPRGNAAPVGRWRKLLGFTIGFATAIGAYVLLVPPFTAWQPSVTTHLSHPASSSPAAAPSAPAVAAPDVAPEAPNTESQAVRHSSRTHAKAVKAHKASSSSTKRHHVRHRAASSH